MDAIGDGLFLTGAGLFFTRGLGLSAGQAGLGLSLAGLIGLGLGALSGRLADRRGPREVFVVLMAGQTIAVASYTLVSGVAELVIVGAAAAICRQGAQAARGALTAQVAPSEAAVLRARLHAVINVGMAMGAAAGGAAIAVNTRAGYRTLMLADAATFAGAASIALLLPRVDRTRMGAGVHVRSALADRRFLLLTGLSAVVSLQFVVSGYLLPLWVAGHTTAPRWLSSPLLLLNTAIVATSQVRTSRRHDGLGRAVLAYRRAGFVLVLSCVLFGASGDVGAGAVASVVLIAAMIAHSVAELLTAAGGFGISFGLAPESAVGEYQGVWNLGFGSSLAIGPGLLTFACLQHGTAGWCLLGLAMAAAAVAVAFLTPVRRTPVRTPTAPALDAQEGRMPA